MKRKRLPHWVWVVVDVLDILLDGLIVLLKIAGLVLFLWFMVELFLWALDWELGLQEGAVKKFLDGLGR